MAKYVSHPILTRGSNINPRAEGHRTEIGHWLIWVLFRVCQVLVLLYMRIDNSADTLYASMKRRISKVFRLKRAKIFRKIKIKGVMKGEKRWWYRGYHNGARLCSGVEKYCTCILFQVYTNYKLYKLGKL